MIDLIMHHIFQSFTLLDMLRNDTRSFQMDLNDAQGGDFLHSSFHLNLSQPNWQRIPHVMLSGLWQWSVNLLYLADSNDPECTHHARLGWRRFKCSYRLFKPIVDWPALPPLAPINAVMFFLSELRDIDVARHEVLKDLKFAQHTLSISDISSLTSFKVDLDLLAEKHRMAVRSLLGDESVGQSIWRLSCWILSAFMASEQSSIFKSNPVVFSNWAQCRVHSLQKKFMSAWCHSQTESDKHRARILAKRLRYAIEDLDGVVQGASSKWHKKAIKVQHELGIERDWMKTSFLAQKAGHEGLSGVINQHRP